MEAYRTIVDLENHLSRSKDAFDVSKYPRHVWDAKGVIVKEDRSVIPSYQPMPSGIAEVLVEKNCDEGKITPQQRDGIIRKMYENCGVFNPPEERFQLDKVIYGLSNPNLYGSNVFFSTLILSGDLQSKEPHASTVGTDEWDYEFKPGTFRLGRTGRVLENSKGRKFDEDLYLSITPDLIWDAIIHGGLHLDKVGLIKENDKIEIVYDRTKSRCGYIEDKFPKPVSLKSRYSDTQIKKIDLTNVAESQGMKVLTHPFCENTKDMSGMYVFNLGTKFKSIGQMINDYSLATDNIVWKLAALEKYTEGNNLNNFLQSTNVLFGDYVFYERKANVSLGNSGRQIKTGESWYKKEDTGYDMLREDERLIKRGVLWEFQSLIPNWQSEYITIKLDKSLLLSALSDLGENEFTQLIMCNCATEEPWEIVYDSRKGIRPETKIEVPKELIEVV